MNNVIAICLAFVAATGAAQQTFHHATHAGSDRTFNGVSIGSKSYYLTSTIPIKGCCVAVLELVAVDHAGAELSRNTLFHYPGLEGCGITKTSDDHLLVYGGTKLKGCDYGDAESLVMRVDTNGVSQWSLTVPFLADAISAATGNEFYMLGDGKVVRYSGLSALDTVQLFSAVPHGVE